MAWVEDLMVGESPGEVNEALMELGAMVCTPTSPGCESCPLTVRCRGLASGDPERFPPPRKTRQPIEIRWLTAVAVANDGSWLLRVISEGPILRGLWLPPFAEIDPTRSLVAQALDLLPVDVVGDPEIRPPISHSITHRRIEVTPAVASVDSMAEVPDGWAWVDPTEPARPTSSLLAKLVRWTKNEW
jgi:A/G-specific adenine glycosylase